jgi:hypothetical protein
MPGSAAEPVTNPSREEAEELLPEILSAIQSQPLSHGVSFDRPGPGHDRKLLKSKTVLESSGDP